MDEFSEHIDVTPDEQTVRFVTADGRVFVDAAYWAQVVHESIHAIMPIADMMIGEGAGHAMHSIPNSMADQANWWYVENDLPPLFVEDDEDDEVEAPELTAEARAEVNLLDNLWARPAVTPDA